MPAKKTKTNAEKNALKRSKSKASATSSTPPPSSQTQITSTRTISDEEDTSNIDYVTEDIVFEGSKDDVALNEQFKDIIAAYASAIPVNDTNNDTANADESKNDDDTSDSDFNSDSDSDTDLETPQKLKLSNRKRKQTQRYTISSLKTLVSNPINVEMHDVTADDPLFLVYLKSIKSSVSVPRHWCLKRKYLQYKRGVEKSGYVLPQYIIDTGIMNLRGDDDEREHETAKAKGRARVAPKIGKIDIDYKVLHAAFFKYMTKPPLTHHGDLYYEGKEYTPEPPPPPGGTLSDELREALGMPVSTDPDGDVPLPVPWLTNMQKFGPPPSYPFLKVPGVNAPLPAGAEYGFHAGGWGKPTVDDVSKLGVWGGEVFGVAGGGLDDGRGNVEYTGDGGVVMVKGFWGEKAVGFDDDEDEDDDEEEEKGNDDESSVIDEGADDKDGTLSVQSGIASVASGFSSVASTVEIRKVVEEEVEDEGPKELFTILKERDRKAVAGEVFGSSTTYVMPGDENDNEDGEEGGGDEDGDENGGGEGENGAAGDESVIAKKPDKGKKKRKKGTADDDDDSDDDGGKKFKF